MTDSARDTAQMQTKTQDPRGVTLRATLVGLALLPLNVYFVVLWETVWTEQYPTTLNICFNAVFWLFVATILNLLLRQVLPRKALTQGELLTIYSILLVAMPASSSEFTQYIYCTLNVIKLT